MQSESIKTDMTKYMNDNKKNNITFSISESLKDYIVYFSITIMISIILGVIGLSEIRTYGVEFFKKKHKFAPCLCDAQRWIKAVKTNKKEKAILAAEKLLNTAFEFEIPNVDYIEVCIDRKLATEILTTKLGKADFNYWHRKLKIKNFADRLTQGKKEKILSLYRYITNSFIIEEKSTHRGLLEIWEDKKGTEQEIIWLFSELTRQLGYTTLIAVFKYKKKNIPYRICRVANKDHVFLINLKQKLFLRDKDILRLVKNYRKLASVIPNSNELEFNSYVFLLPTEIYDMRDRNQVLYKRLIESGCPQIPVFGMDPKTTLDNITSKHLYLPKYKFAYWNFSILHR